MAVYRFSHRDNSVEEFHRAKKMAIKALETMCDIADEMEDEFRVDERRYDQRGYSERGYNRRDWDNRDWDEMDERRMRDSRGRFR